jgi:hypothetical protein
MNDPIYRLIDGIKIYDGTTLLSREEYSAKIAYLQSLTESPLFEPLQPSTLTAQGEMSMCNFIEENIISTLTEPTGHILMIGCNYGEKFNINYTIPEVKKNSGRGRRPKPKPKSRRKIQGNGKYFSSQITFLIEHPVSKCHYKIKLFRNGVFQVPGIRNPDMTDLVEPVNILREYLSYNFGEEIYVNSLTAVMRNYKSSLVNHNYHINLEKLEEIILREKINPIYEKFLNNMLVDYDVNHREKIKELMNNYNVLNIAEMTYNTDRCFCLIIKFYRPSLLDPDKKTTVKLLKKGKINFDGGNSQQEIEELYAWLEYIYNKHFSEILFDINTITNDTDTDTTDPYTSIYDSDDTPTSRNPNDVMANALLRTKRIIVKKPMLAKYLNSVVSEIGESDHEGNREDNIASD